MNDNRDAMPSIGKNDDVRKKEDKESRDEPAKNKQQRGSVGPENPMGPTKPLGGKSIGPRTAFGRRRSSRNALKNGFYSRKFLLESESKTEYQFFVSALREAFQPLGDLEDLLVEELAMLWMRKKRLLQAERAEIALAIDFVEVDLAIEQQKQLYEIQESEFFRNGQLSACSNPFVLDMCIALLEVVQKDLENNMFDPEKHSKTHQSIYGLSWTVDPSISLLTTCKKLMEKAETAKLNQGQEAIRDYEEERQRVIENLEVEIERLITMKVKNAIVQKQRIEYRKQAGLVPSSEAFERILRTSASLSREFERKLSLLERLQRRRQGLPVPSAVRG